MDMKKEFVIFGNPVEHSKSPQMHNAGFKALEFDGEYKKHLLEDGETIKKVFLENGYSGANITVPHKEVAFRNADEVIGLANEIKAVNTYINDNGKIIAYNTDAPGFLYAIESFGEIKSVLILGAGGTAKAVSLALQQSDVDVTILNRSDSKLSFFKDHKIKAYSWDKFNPEKYDLVVNTTSAGLKDDSYPCDKELLEKILKEANGAFDCIYGKITPFLALANELGIPNKDGEDMLLYQGVLAFEYFTEDSADEDVIEAMRQGLKQ
jgi:shikimate dehydrogenase